MTVCRDCRAELAEGERCRDRKACLKRVRRSLRDSLGTMITKKYVGGFDPDKAYKDQMGKP